ncbi:hypothetical protein HZC32_01680 [Candidatus Woesearchaeota archaeon]|nr:hypothetical protein [Candidatus Woesearchaeota archaeon]
MLIDPHFYEADAEEQSRLQRILFGKPKKGEERNRTKKVSYFYLKLDQQRFLDVIVVQNDNPFYQLSWKTNLAPNELHEPFIELYRSTILNPSLFEEEDKFPERSAWLLFKDRKEEKHNLERYLVKEPKFMEHLKQSSLDLELFQLVTEYFDLN